MTTKCSKATYWLTGILVVLSVIMVLKGCRRDHADRSPAAPVGSRNSGVHLKITKGIKPQAKAVGLRIDGVALDGSGETIKPIVIANPVFPLDVAVTFSVPPCVYQMTITLSLLRDQTRVAQVRIDACQQTTVTISLDTFEVLLIPPGVDPIQAPDEALAGATIPVRCGTSQVSAPDSDRYPLTAVLWEKSGQSVSGPFDAATEVSGSFPDPFPQTSLATQRVFSCTIRDGRSPDQTFTKIIRRLPDVDGDGVQDTTDNCPLVANADQADADGDGMGDACDMCPNDPDNDIDGDGICGDVDPCPNDPDNDIDGDGICGDVDICPNDPDNDIDGDGVCGDVDNCPLVVNPDQADVDGNGIGDLCDPCTVINNNDSGAGSLRQVLANAPANGCSVVTFAAGLPTITLTSGQVTVPVMTVTIDGSGGTVSGGGTSRVFFVNAGTTVTFQNLTIRDGQAGSGGGIANNGGTVTVNGTVSGNTASSGGGISNCCGVAATIIVNGTVSGNTAIAGGGIYNNGGPLTVNGTVSGNTATNLGGGIYLTLFSGAVTIAASGTVSGNTATNEGGGILNDGGPLTVNGTVSGNTATNQGGGIYNMGTVNIAVSGRVISNTANGGPGSGGGVFNNGGSLTGANGTTVNSNTPDQCAPVACP